MTHYRNNCGLVIDEDYDDDSQNNYGNTYNDDDDYQEDYNHSNDDDVNYQNNEDNDGGDYQNNDDENNDNCGNGEENDDDTQNSYNNTSSNEGPKFIRLRGLPWSATNKEILEFLKNVNVINNAAGIHLVTNRWDGKNTGEAYVEVQSEQDVQAALKLDNANMGHRYIEVFNAQPKEAREAMRKTGTGMSYVVKLRGLPYSVTEKQIEEFFKGLEIKPDREGITFVMDRRGRATGEAFVQFVSQEDTEQALGRNREKIGHRYIEIFRSSLAELKRSTGSTSFARVAPYDIRDRGSNRINNNDFDNKRGNRWLISNNGGFGIGANNTLGFSNLPSFNNNRSFASGNNGNAAANFIGGMSGTNNNLGSKFRNNSTNNMANIGNFNNTSSNFPKSGNGKFTNNSGPFNSRFSGNNGNFGNDFGNFGNHFNNNRNNDGNTPFGGFGNFGGNNAGNFNSNMSNIGSMVGGGNADDCDYFAIHMRGLPYTSFENDVFKFFDPIRPANVRINYNEKNRHSGTADVYFDTYDDAQKAMKRHREKIGSRYIELFFDGKVKNDDMCNEGGFAGSRNTFSRLKCF